MRTKKDRQKAQQFNMQNTIDLYKGTMALLDERFPEFKELPFDRRLELTITAVNGHEVVESLRIVADEVSDVSLYLP